MINFIEFEYNHTNYLFIRVIALQRNAEELFHFKTKSFIYVDSAYYDLPK